MLASVRGPSDADSRVISDPKGLGRLSQCMVGVTVEPSEIDAVLEQVCSRQIRVRGLGRLSQCMVGVTVEPSEIDAVLEQVCSREEVTFAAGSYDLMLCISVDSPDKLGEFLLTGLGSIPGIHRIESYMLLSVGKDSLGQFTS